MEFTFEKTKLWSALSERAKRDTALEATREFVSQVLKHVEPILNERDGDLMTFHDAAHSFRVAENSARLMGSQLGGLNASELSLMLLASYLHDAGMHPPESWRARFKVALKNLRERRKDPAAPPELDVDEKTRAFTEWAQHRLDCADQDVMEDWVRTNHNSLSKVVMESAPALQGGGPDVNVLLTVCQSHHVHVEKLQAGDYDPKLFRNQSVRLRLLCVVLRLADILEIGPARAPWLVANHRGIESRSPESNVHWEKERCVDVLIEEKLVRLASSPLRPRVEERVRNDADLIQAELTACFHLAVQNPDWTWVGPAVLKREFGSRYYTYINGRVRPSAANLPKLFERSPSEDLCAVARELIYNAVDAVRQVDVIRKQRGEKSQFPHNPAVRLVVKDMGDKLTFNCEDWGAGMDIGILENDFLVPGKRARPDLDKLRPQGFQPSACLGVGALLYFMVADKLTVWTRREEHAWLKFEIDGLRGFGELAEGDRGPDDRYSGTIVELGISKRFWERQEGTSPGHFAFSKLADSARRFPCNVQFVYEDGRERKGGQTPAPRVVTVGPEGETGDQPKLPPGVGETWAISGTLASKERRSLAEWYAELEWKRDGDRACLAETLADGTIGCAPERGIDHCWHGFSVEEKFLGLKSFFRLTINWLDHEAARLLVPGSEIRVTALGERYVREFLARPLFTLLDESFLTKLRASRYATLNAILSGFCLDASTTIAWRQTIDGGSWQEVKFPAWTGRPAIGRVEVDLRDSDQKPVTELLPIAWTGSADRFGLFLPTGSVPVIRELPSVDTLPAIGLVWREREDTYGKEAFPRPCARMSPKWEGVLAVILHPWKLPIFNFNHSFWQVAKSKRAMFGGETPNAEWDSCERLFKVLENWTDQSRDDFDFLTVLKEIFDVMELENFLVASSTRKMFQVDRHGCRECVWMDPGNEWKLFPAG